MTMILGVFDEGKCVLLLNCRVVQVALQNDLTVANSEKHFPFTSLLDVFRCAAWHAKSNQVSFVVDFLLAMMVTIRK